MPQQRPTTLIAPLTGIRRALLRRAVMLNAADGLATAAGLFVLLEIWQLGFRMTESTAGILAAGGLALAAGAFLVRHVRLILRQPGPAALALQVEKARPELLRC